MASSSRGRDRRGGEYRLTVRRTRSPLPPPKRRSYSPPPAPAPAKRRPSPSPEREMSRRPKVSKCAVSSRGGSELRYNDPDLEPEPRPVRNVSSSERFREKEYEEVRVVKKPAYTGAEGLAEFNMKDLRKITIEVKANPSSSPGESTINRSIINPVDIPVRRPDEGSRPLFLNASSSNKERSASVDYKRIVAINNSRGSVERERAHSRERPPQRYSPVPGPSHYEDHRRSYYPERERAHSPYETRLRSPHRDEYVEPREKHRERRAGSREDLRRDLDVRKREDRRYSPERRLSYERDHRERESDLRSRINEKRSDPHSHPRIEERERERRYEVDRERERHGRAHHSSPPRERRRPGSPDRHEGSRDRRETWERDREREGRDRDREGRERESRRRAHSREREPREHSGHYEESRHPPSSHKSDYEPKKFYKNYEMTEFIPPPVRGRGLPIRRGIPPILRGRGIPRGMTRGFRGGVMVPRGMPRGGPFMPRFPPRFFPPY